jgi:hypothetical protein
MRISRRHPLASDLEMLLERLKDPLVGTVELLELKEDRFSTPLVGKEVRGKNKFGTPQPQSRDWAREDGVVSPRIGPRIATW